VNKVNFGPRVLKYDSGHLKKTEIKFILEAWCDFFEALVSERQKVVDRVTLYVPLNMNDSKQLGGKQILTSDEAELKRHIPSRDLDMEDLTERRNYLHNSRTLIDLKEGDRVEIKRSVFYSHWGIYVGDGKIVHLVGVGVNGLDQSVRPDVLFKISGKIFSKAKVCRDDFWDVVREHQANVNNCDYLRCILPTDEIIKRANGSVGNVGYNVIYNNCEHFATWCRYDKVESRQIQPSFQSASEDQNLD
ncbi:hypothetical protein Btru_073548, partial [Bulinus truncatus]